MARHSLGFYVVLVIAIIAVVTSYHLLAPILLAFIIILLVVLAANPVILRLRELTGGRRLAALVFTFVFLVVVGLAIWAFITPIRTSTTKLTQRFPEYWEQIQRPLIKLEKQAAVSEARLDREVTTEVARSAAAEGNQQGVQQVLNGAKKGEGKSSGGLRAGIVNFLQGVAGEFKGFAHSAAEMAVVLATVFFGVLFTLMNPRPIFTGIISWLPQEQHERALRVLRRIAEFVPLWALSTLAGMVCIGLLVFLIMWPIFGFMDALILGVIAGVMEAVPYLGPTLSAVPGMLLALGVGGMTPVWVLLAYIFVQALENNVILPLIMAKGMQLHPVAVIFSMLLCVTAFGVLGGVDRRAHGRDR